LAVCAGSCGPGNLHLINGLFDCHRSRVPVLGIAAQIPSGQICGANGQVRWTSPRFCYPGSNSARPLPSTSSFRPSRSGWQEIVTFSPQLRFRAAKLLGAGFSLLAFHERGARDAVVMPGWRAPPVAGNEEWDDPECRRATISLSCADLPAEGNSTDRVHAPS